MKNIFLTGDEARKAFRELWTDLMADLTRPVFWPHDYEPLTQRPPFALWLAHTEPHATNTAGNLIAALKRLPPLREVQSKSELRDVVRRENLIPDPLLIIGTVDAVWGMYLEDTRPK